MRRLSAKFYGVPPPRGAPRLERLRYLRRVAYLCSIPTTLIVCALFAVELASPLNWIVAGVLAVWWLGGFATINFQIRREQRRQMR